MAINKPWTLLVDSKKTSMSTIRRGHPAGSKNKSATSCMASEETDPTTNKTNVTIQPSTVSAPKRGRPPGSKNKIQKSTSNAIKQVKKSFLLAGLFPFSDDLFSEKLSDSSPTQHDFSSHLNAIGDFRSSSNSFLIL